MLVSFAQHTIELKSWETSQGMIEFLQGCDAGSPLFLGEDSAQENSFYSAVVNLDWNRASVQRFGIGIYSGDHGLKPHLLLQPDGQTLVLGFNNEAVGVSINDKRELFRISLDSLFRSFVLLSQKKIILVFHEIGVVAIAIEGQELWRYDKDIITECRIEGESLQLKFMDSPSVNLNIPTGESNA